MGKASTTQFRLGVSQLRGLMPFKSEAQRKWMYAKYPAMAVRWEKETPPGKLPKLKRRIHGTSPKTDRRHPA